jgi:hypothetical protein
VDEALQQLVDRQAIVDCLHRYTRGVDRMDEELILSAFHEDAIDFHHGHTGTAKDFVEWFWPAQESRVTCQHYLTNITVDIDGDVAHSESYFLTASRWAAGDTVRHGGGRYVDRLERRNGEWRIAQRVVVVEWAADSPGWGLDMFDPVGRSRRDASDLSYQRPLREEGIDPIG